MFLYHIYFARCQKRMKVLTRGRRQHLPIKLKLTRIIFFKSSSIKFNENRSTSELQHANEQITTTSLGCVYFDQSAYIARFMKHLENRFDIEIG
jgi:hypothetical protein